ncbi:MAG: TonB-dependent receptor [Acidobacteriaceae bacterium]|jgi:iron complex outermembrane receptor protein|nr:TonB-dependent receptor [Acidobacteriaceae bacterium]
MLHRWFRSLSEFPLLRIAAFVLLATISTIPAYAQTGSVSGAVLDPDSKAVVGAIVLLRNEATNASQTISTDNAGRFTAKGLEPGRYALEIVVPGFDLVRRNNIDVSSAAANVDIKLTVANIAEDITVMAALPAAAAAAPSQSSLTARSAQSLISSEYIRNYTSPISDYSQTLQMAPGTFSTSSNGPGLGDTKTFFRGFKDGNYSMTFDGIPFNDTNDPTHHSWVFFPAQTIGSTLFDRSPGSASSIGPSTYGGSVGLVSPALPVRQQVTGTVSYGSFNTRMYDMAFDSGAIGNSRFMIEGHDMQSDGYQTFNYQHRKAFQAKYQYAFSDSTVVSAFTSVVQLDSNTPNQSGSTRAQIQQFGNNFLMTDSPTSPLYYKYNFYSVPTDFEYVGLKSNLGHGWSIDNKLYTMRYYNDQHFNSTTAISATSATDKLNSYRKYGDLIPLTQVSSFGVFRTGLWMEYATSDRHQTPADPRTWDLAALPNFHETFNTTTLQPYGEYEVQVTPRFRVTPGVKLAYYKQDFTQFADNGKVVGNLNGAPYVQHAVSYNTWLPSLDAHYLIQSAWSVYGQWGKGQQIPPTSIFDVTGAQVAVLPKPTTTNTMQVGSVWKSNRATLDVDYYHIHFDNDYSSDTDPATGFTSYYAAGSALTQGVEAESTILVGGGLALYLNATTGSAKYATGEWVQNAPKDTETLGLTYNKSRWNLGFFNKRVGTMYNDNGAVHQAFTIDPFNITNLFVNYTIGGGSLFSDSRIRLAVNNLTDNHAITGIKGGTAAATSASPTAGDLLTLMSGRSISVAFSVGVHGR